VCAWGCALSCVRCRGRHAECTQGDIRACVWDCQVPTNQTLALPVPPARPSPQQHLPPWRSGAGCCCGSARPWGTGLPPRRARRGWRLLGSPCPGVPAAGALGPGLRTKRKQSELLERQQKCQDPRHLLWRKERESRAAMSRDAPGPWQSLLPSLHPGGRGNTHVSLQAPGASPPTRLCSAAPRSALTQPPATKVSWDRWGGGRFTPEATQTSHVPVRCSAHQAALPTPLQQHHGVLHG